MRRPLQPSLGVLILIVMVSTQAGRLASQEPQSDYVKCSVGKGGLDLTIGICTRVIESGGLPDEKLAWIFYSRGWRYGATGKFDRAIADYNRAIRLKRDYAHAFRDRGRAYERKGEYDKAIMDYNHTTRIEPKNVQAYRDRGRVYRRTGDYDKALKEYDLATRLAPGFAHSFRERGRVYRRMGLYDRAIEDYDQAIRLKPGLASAFYRRGLAHGKKGRYDRAIQDYDQAIRLKPGSAQGYNELAWLLATAKVAQYRDGRRAVELARKAVSLKDTANHRDTMAAAYAEAGRFDDAARELEHAISLLRSTGIKNKIEDFQSRLDLYRSGRPYRQE